MNKKDFFESLGILTGAVATYIVGLSTNSVFSASLVGLVSGLFLPEYSIMLYIGAFVGMSSYIVLPNVYYFMFAAIFSSLFWLFFSSKIPSLGGKAGFTAFMGVLIASFFSPTASNFAISFNNSETIISIIFVAMAATIATFAVRKKIGKRKGEAVIGSSLIGMVAGAMSMFFPWLSKLSAIAYSASFAGMTEFKYLEKEYYPVLIGLIVGVVFFLSAPLFPGFGGKLGTIAFISVLLFLYLTRN